MFAIAEVDEVEAATVRLRNRDADLLVLALIMVMSTAAASLIKEVDKRTMSRLILSRLSVAEFLTAVSANQVLIGVTALALTFLAALSVGYRTDGSLAALRTVALRT